MRVYCTAPNGVSLHNDFDRSTAYQEVALHFGVNDVDDGFAKPWFAYHADPAHPSALIVDHTVYELVEDKPAKVAKEPKAPPANGKAKAKPEAKANEAAAQEGNKEPAGEQS